MWVVRVSNDFVEFNYSQNENNDFGDPKAFELEQKWGIISLDNRIIHLCFVIICNFKLFNLASRPSSSRQNERNSGECVVYRWRQYIALVCAALGALWRRQRNFSCSWDVFWYNGFKSAGLEKADRLGLDCVQVSWTVFWVLYNSDQFWTLLIWG